MEKSKRHVHHMLHSKWLVSLLLILVCSCRAQNTNPENAAEKDLRAAAQAVSHWNLPKVGKIACRIRLGSYVSNNAVSQNGLTPKLLRHLGLNSSNSRNYSLEGSTTSHRTLSGAFHQNEAVSVFYVALSMGRAILHFYSFIMSSSALQ